jgi:hypothetical protein
LSNPSLGNTMMDTRHLGICKLICPPVAKQLQLLPGATAHKLKPGEQQGDTALSIGQPLRHPNPHTAGEASIMLGLTLA